MKTDTTTGALRPLTLEHWRPDPFDDAGPHGFRPWMHRRQKLVALSSVGPMQAPDGSGDIIDTWHLSVAARVVNAAGKQEPVRPTVEQFEHLLDTWAITEFEIDNHHPGSAQHLMIPVDPARRVDCECKANETVIVEPDGYTWTNPVDGPCRGCEHERMTGRPCPLHPNPVTATTNLTRSRLILP